jgi:hypothetical protein
MQRRARAQIHLNGINSLKLNTIAVRYLVDSVLDPDSLISDPDPAF